MATVAFTTRESNVSQAASFNFTSDGSAQIVNLGFKPQYVKIVNETDSIIWEWFEGLAATKTVKITGVPAVTIDTGSAIVYNGDGTITLSATLVGTAKVIKGIAFI